MNKGQWLDPPESREVQGRHPKESSSLKKGEFPSSVWSVHFSHRFGRRRRRPLWKGQGEDKPLTLRDSGLKRTGQSERVGGWGREWDGDSRELWLERDFHWLYLQVKTPLLTKITTLLFEFSRLEDESLFPQELVGRTLHWRDEDEFTIVKDEKRCHYVP